MPRVKKFGTFRLNSMGKSIEINMDHGCGICDSEEFRHLNTRLVDEKGWVSEFKCNGCGDVIRLSHHHHNVID
ncbi:MULTISPECIES: hypothetical protein [Carboxydocella]|uniref:Uncharacterized protein n=2 Tax=Carboxydocella TaxID=178898 RepID=A0A1T4MPI7_9FIRM|nr:MULTISPECIES: hypothetical protein [Carboxydocella]AVX20380.1 hypothetical protein CFE_1185 [Carboxydocella thermautotrophica]AVX30804.1 hypothetical protein CTH_1207 [Carboxydocella thermautotrophica]SJZ69030.1 hypothetical protein SAMN02745885_00657 [Carboxydocella sporoproducens DSM 16521]GAW30051.1 hypothetical protein ULO1_26210 [Carboxydocella sp. ULO1]GAW31209.1 hypothetical protein JDF658_09740 [Carboxydocella sp. JDF658]